MNIISQYPIWIYFSCLLLAAAFSYFLYRNDKKLREFKAGVVLFLALLRFASMAIILLLLCSPLVSYKSKSVQEPILVFALDNSSSMLYGEDSSFVKNQLKEELDALKNKLKDSYQIDSYLFDENAEKTSDTANFKGTTTSFSNLFEDLKARYDNRNVGAIILLSDGIYNQGLNPLYMETSSIPIYCVSFGDTSLKKDASINHIANNEIAFLNNDFPVEVELRLNQLKGKSGEIQIFQANKKLFAEKFTVNEEDEIIKVPLSIEAKEIGLTRYTAVLSQFEGERVLLNNQMDFYVDILDGRQRILLLARAPHPDINAIKESLNRKKSLQLEVFQLNEFKGNYTDYDLVIFHHLPGKGALNIRAICQELEEANISTFFMISPESVDWPLFNSMNIGLKVKTNGFKGKSVNAQTNSSFPLFQLTEQEINAVKKFPPLIAPHAEYEYTRQAFSLLNQRIGAVETPYPLLAFFQKETHKSAVLLGTNLWHWRIYDFLENSNHEAFDALILKSIQYLAVKSDKSYFRVNHQDAFLENEKVLFDAQLYNESYELINTPEISILLSDEQGKEYNYSFSRNSKSYYLSIPSLPAGNYSYIAETKLAEKVRSEKGQFSIRKIQLEENRLQADYNLLFQLAKNSGGEVISKDKLANLYDILEARPDISSIAYEEEEIEDSINLTWILWILLGTLSLEWFIRKREGAY